MKRNVILVTDGDRVAKRAVERAAENIGARCISSSAGNPTRLSGEQIVNMIMSAPHDPVVVMLDDRGKQGTGQGERALEYIAAHPDINVLGALAVASNTLYTAGTTVDESVTSEGSIVSGPVDKLGHQRPGTDHYLEGDTVEILDRLNIPVVVGIGDIGKMDGADDPDRGSPLTTKALREIMDRSGFVENSR
ncbi:MAG: stage V sporulation protein AE [Peptococcaceae bacterium BRH_c4b]|nr:MAG: stage V sporulation protein AE [Peptococcaceae bacterium BRH_c4b]